MRPNSRKIGLWSCPGALWAPSWRQYGPRATPRAEFNEKYSILRWPVGSKMEPKSIKNWWKSHLIFVTISRALFLILGRFWFQKPLQNEGSQGHFFDLVANMWKVWFGTTLPSFCYIFRFWKHRFSILKCIFFNCFFEAAFKTHFFRFWVDFWSKLEAKWEPKSEKKSIKFEAGILMIF